VLAVFTYMDDGLATKRRLELEQNDVYNGHFGDLTRGQMTIILNSN